MVEILTRTASLELCLVSEVSAAGIVDYIARRFA